MIQRLIELGDGYADIYELCELAKKMPERVIHFVSLRTEKNGRKVTSPAIIMSPSTQGNFQPIYICMEGVPDPESGESKRYELFKKIASEQEHEIKSLIVKSSAEFHEKTLYFQYLIGIFQMNRLIKIH
ncbi:DUF7147 family protein [Sediminibacillus halophilus]|uniref:DUF7147 domain-containing protein n=1 Tax=Sediminibacillus halophilus TaxID=482461 RepID=A0A1G9MUE8_9BACI|nr:methylthioribose kinase [Sediminibacillus halophilus]SDL77547.1 hypothetical protein SAMN05216244_0720 [Sediminibacillus halophilus]